jgi:hypothetical protein
MMSATRLGKRLTLRGFVWMPPDDIEIRALLRAGVQRGLGGQEIVVQNPSPDVHHRLRQYLDRDLTSTYEPVPSLS